MIQINLHSPTVGELLRWCIAFAAIGYFADVAGASHAANVLAPAALCASLFGAGAFNIAAWAMIFARAARPLPHLPAGPGWIVLAMLCGVLCALPLGLALVPALAGLGLALWWAPGLPRNCREIAMLLLALGASWASAYARFLHVVAGRLDAPVAAALAGLAGVSAQSQGNLITTGNFSLEILPACASTAPLPTVVLAYVVVVLYRRRPFSRADIGGVAASLLYSIGLTELRLALMVPSQADWNFWHNGGGVTVYELAALAGAAGFPWLAGASRTRRAAAAARVAA